MEREVRSQMYRMIGVMVMLLGLGLYAHKFVIDGIMAKAALNLSIFALFFLAAYIAFRWVLNLKNDMAALKALQTDFDKRNRHKTDAYSKPAIVFHEPALLGHAYSLIAEGLSRQKNFQIKTATAHGIIHAIDTRIMEKKSTIGYFSGLLVFLGLLGAFMGLMKTVGSVGDLIGGMDVSGKGGSDQFGKLIEGMKAPLNGMAVGFSSSLFGLATSLALGTYERFMLVAMKSVRNEFDAWLTGISQLEGADTETETKEAETPAIVSRALLKSAARLGKLETNLDRSVQLAATSAQSVNDLSVAVRALVSVVQEQHKPIERDALTGLAEQVAQAQRDSMAQMAGLMHAHAKDRDTLRRSLTDLVEAVDRLEHHAVPVGRVAPLQPPEVTLHAPPVPVNDDPVANPGALGLLDKLSVAFGGPRAADRRYAALADELLNRVEANDRTTERVVRKLETSRTADRALIRAYHAKQEKLFSVMAVLAQRMDGLTQQLGGEESKALAGMRDDLDRTRLALELQLKRLELQVNDQKGEVAVDVAGQGPSEPKAAVVNG
jgi:hypothetical protein